MHLPRALALLLCLVPALALGVEQFTYRVLEKLPQSRQLFVQGFQIIDGQLYVSTGNYGQSGLLRYSFPGGELDAARRLHPRLFAEGVTALGDHVYQLTWRSRLMLVYDRSALTIERSSPLPGEGWGMTTDGEYLIYSDGSDQLHFMAPDTGRVVRSVSVTEEGKPLRQLNELEWIDGKVWSNVWRSDRVVMIDPETGRVTGNLDLTGLLPDGERQAGTDVLNGIARNPADGAIWVTGKRWPWIYRLEVLPKSAQVP